MGACEQRVPLLNLGPQPAPHPAAEASTAQPPLPSPHCPCCLLRHMQVWREALRLHPAGSVVPIREADRTVTLRNGARIPKGTIIW